mgnify:CR=1 FL=1
MFLVVTYVYFHAFPVPRHSYVTQVVKDRSMAIDWSVDIAIKPKLLGAPVFSFLKRQLGLRFSPEIATIDCALHLKEDRLRMSKT